MKTMKFRNIIRDHLNIITLALTCSAFTSCTEEINIAPIDEGNYSVPSSEKTMVYILDGEGKRQSGIIEFRDQGTCNLYVNFTKRSTGAIVGFEYNAAALEQYNKKHGTSYELMPEAQVDIPKEVIITAGSSQSTKVEISFKSIESTTDKATAREIKTYVIPVTAKVKSGDIKFPESNQTFFILAKDYSNIPDCNKSTGIKLISCMEVNDTNPLNNLCFTLENSGKPLVDIVILFSANITYNEEKGRVEVYCNSNVQHLLSNRDKYIKPLQDRGIKVLLGILGNHDRAGIAGLSDNNSRLFAQDLKSVVEAYHLDGVFFDDEYSNYFNESAGDYPTPGFVLPSYTAASRFVYEAKKAMPDKLVSVYVYTRTSSLYTVDGCIPGEYIDYAIHDYGNSYSLSSNYEGLPKSRWAMYSQEYNLGKFHNYALQSIRDNGYAHMIFAMDPYHKNFDTQLSSMKQIASTLFDEELVYDEKPYKKDW